MLWLIFLTFCALGTAQHFLYVPLGKPKWLAWLLPVSESPWEHYKLAFWPLGGALCLTGALAGTGLEAVLWAWMKAAVHGFCTMLGLYYFYRSALGVPHPMLWADIVNYYVTMICGWKVGLGGLSATPSPGLAAAAGCILAGCALLFARAANATPAKYPMFLEEKENGRNQRTGTS